MNGKSGIKIPTLQNRENQLISQSKPSSCISQPHSDTDVSPWPTLQKCQSPEIPNFWKFLLKTNAADQNQGHQQRSWDPSAIQVGWWEVQNNFLSMRRMWSTGERVRPGMCPGTWAIHWICICSPRFPVCLQASPVMFSNINWALFLPESCGDREAKCINDCLTQISVTRASQTPGLIY